jgi:hypothetical protein
MSTGFGPFSAIFSKSISGRILGKGLKNPFFLKIVKKMR